MLPETADRSVQSAAHGVSDAVAARTTSKSEITSKTKPNELSACQLKQLRQHHMPIFDFNGQVKPF